MPEFDFGTLAVWILSFGCELILCACMLYRGSVRRWPSLFCYLTLQAVRDALLLAVALGMRNRDAAAADYFWIYWAGQAVLQLAQLWMMWQVIVDHGGVNERARGLLLRGYAATLVLAILISAAVTSGIEGPFYMRVTREVLASQRCASFAWILVVLAMTMAVVLAGMNWGREAFAVSLGFTVTAAATAICSAMIHDHSSWTSFFGASNVLYLFTLAFWGSAFVPPRPAERQILVARGELAAVVDNLLVAYERIKSR
jgi:hypothetical protein